tara:strand:+ start:116 stop:478 length:363 start_codon:yes stop_codon:yes gene_type:complete
MDIEDFEDNSMVIVMTINDGEGGLDLKIGHTIADDFDDEEKSFYLDMLNGIIISMREGMDKLAFDGMMARHLSKLTGRDMDDEFSTEMPDERHADLLKEIKDIALGPNGENVVSFKKKLH